MVIVRKPTQAEIIAIRASIEEASRPGATWYTHEQVKTDITKLLRGEEIEEFDEDSVEAHDWTVGQ